MSKIVRKRVFWLVRGASGCWRPPVPQNIPIGGVSTPYDISVVTGDLKAAISYRGLTRPDPTLLYLKSTGSSKQATISGYVPTTTDPNTMFVVFFMSGGMSWADYVSPSSQGFYSITAYWNANVTSYSGTLGVIQIKYSSTATGNPPEKYDGYASRGFTITAGGTFTSGTSFGQGELTDPAESNIGGTFQCATNYTVVGKELYLMIGNATVMIDYSYETVNGISSTFNYIVPSIPGVKFGIHAVANNPLNAGRATLYSGPALFRNWK